MIGTQLYLVVSGNYAWLNWVTIVILAAGIDDRTITAILGFVPGAAPALGGAPAWFGCGPRTDRARRRAELVPGPQPAQPAPDDERLVRSPPAGEHVRGLRDRQRYEVVIEGTPEADPGPDAEWREYEFKGKPGDPHRIREAAPYHLRLDWLMWFLPLSRQYGELVHVVPGGAPAG